MSSQTILVIGGSGFIGSAVLEELTVNGNNVLATSFSQNQNLIPFNILVRESWSEIIEQYKPTTVISTAWETEHRAYWTKSSNYDYMEATIGFARECFENSVDKFIGLGTSSEYGYSPGACDKDRTELNPFGFYSECKVETGIRLKELSNSYGKLSNWVRLFQPFGPKEKPERLIPKLIESVYKDQKTEILYPQHLLDFTFSKTIANGINYVLLNNLDHFVDLGAGEPLTVQNMASDIVDSLGKDLELLTYGAEHDQDERFCYVDRTSEIFKSGWSPRHTTLDNLRQHCDSYRKLMDLHPILKNVDRPKG